MKISYRINKYTELLAGLKKILGIPLSNCQKPKTKKILKAARKTNNRTDS